MKKVLALMLALILALSLVACGSSDKKDDTTGEAEATEAEKVINIGDTIQTDAIELELSKVVFSDTYGRDDFGNSVEASDGYTFILVTFSIRNIGKEKVYPPNMLLCYDIPYVDYNNGYLYEPITGDGDNEGLTFSGLEPLAKSKYIISVLHVPEELKTNTSAPLLVKFRVPTSTGIQEYTYKFR